MLFRGFKELLLQRKHLECPQDVKRYTISLVIKEIKLKLAIRYSIPTKMVKVKITNSNKYRQEHGEIVLITVLLL